MVVETDMGDREISPVEERLVSPSAPRLSTEYCAETIVSNQYRIDAKIGDGGMGTVYRCTDLLVKRTVAIKFLHPHLVNTSKWLLRFQQEAKVIGRLHHPNIIRIHQFCADVEPPFIVMDYIEGTSLSDILSLKGSIEVKRCLKIMQQVADALSHAHANGVVHRDLKPSNVMLLKNDQVQILDFGIAKLDEADAGEFSLKLTLTGEVFGSPAYMSPEQCTGKAVNAQSDQYSFGCMLYECLTGSPPFVAGSAVEVMMRHVADEPVSLKEASLGKQFPAELEVLMKKLLAKKKEDRFSSMDQVRNLIAEIGKSGVKSQPVAPDKRKHSPRKIAMFTAIALAVLAAGLLTAFFIWRISEAPAAKPPSTELASTIKTADPAEAKAIIRANQAMADELRAHVVHTPKDGAFGPPRDKLISDEGVALIKQYMPNAGAIYLGDCIKLTDGCLESLVDIPLLSLHLGGTQIDNEGAATIAKMKKLRELYVNDTAFGDKGMSALAKLPFLYAVNLANTNISARGIRTLASSQKLRFLWLNGVVDLSGSFKFLRDNPIELLSLEGCSLTRADLMDIAQIKTLSDLTLAGVHLGDKDLDTLMTMSQLKHLSLRRCPLNFNKLEPLRKALPQCEIEM